MRSTRTFITVALIIPLLGVPGGRIAAEKASKGPLKVFILAGQSNMEGQAVVDLDHERYYNGGKGNLEHVMKHSPGKHLYRHLRGKDGKWTVRDDVWVWYQPGKGKLKSGGLSIGYAVYGGKHHFGPELQFGHVIGDHLNQQVLLIKTAWGGKSLYKDFRPPSSGGQVGPYYTMMLEQVRGVLGDIKKHFPAYGGQGCEIAGFVWFQGWNDMCTKEAIPQYEDNLVNLIGDIRKEFKTPNLPVVIGELGNGGPKCGANMQAIRKAQAAAAKRPEVGKKVTFVQTHRFARPASESPNTGHGHHWFGNAESYFLIGNAMGEAMKKLLPDAAGEKTTR